MLDDPVIKMSIFMLAVAIGVLAFKYIYEHY